MENDASPAKRRAAGAARLLAELAKRGRLTAVEAHLATKLPESAARTVIRELAASGKIRPRGQGRARSYALPAHASNPAPV
jgi:Fic family protein